MPAYNAARFLEAAIASVLAQTLHDWELIVVNDGSFDNTEEVVLRVLDSRVKCLAQTNQGVSAARNAGIHLAQGTYLSFLDADDAWHPEFLERCLAVLSKRPDLAGVYTYYQVMDMHGTLLPQIGGHVVPAEEFREALVEENLFAIHAAVTRTSVVREAGLFDPALACAEDWDLWFRIAEHHQMVGIPEPLAYYRVSEDSASSDPARTHMNHRIFFEKHHGPIHGDAATWNEAKRRAYGFNFRLSGLEFVKQGRFEEGWQLLTKAFSAWPALLTRSDTFYEVLCGDQPRGYRGQADELDLKANSWQVLAHLNLFFSHANPDVAALRRAAYGQMYLVSAMLADQAGDWSDARYRILQAIKYDPRLLASYPVVRRAIKLFAGQTLVKFAQTLVSPNTLRS
jgi:glycosyltransferase involved in cell wall biosynthesis